MLLVLGLVLAWGAAADVCHFEVMFLQFNNRQFYLSNAPLCSHLSHIVSSHIRADLRQRPAGSRAWRGRLFRLLLQRHEQADKLLRCQQQWLPHLHSFTAFDCLMGPQAAWTVLTDSAAAYASRSSLARSGACSRPTISSTSGLTASTSARAV